MRHQVSDVPRVKAEVTEYQRHSLSCTTCGTVTRAEWPQTMPQGAFGPRAQAIVGYLTGRLGGSHRDVVEAMKALYSLDLRTRSVSAIERQVSQALALAVERARRASVRQSGGS